MAEGHISNKYLKIKRGRIYDSYRKKYKQERVGRLAKKVLLILAAGFSLSLTHRPDRYFRIIRSAAKEWQKINSKNLNETVRRLYKSQMIDYEENKDGTVSLVLAKEGKIRVLRYKLDEIALKKPANWDGFWRMVIFDIPEHKKQVRDVFSKKLKQLGFVAIQKSVFVYPHDCQNELDFVVEIFGLRPYVRFALVKELDIAVDLRRKFGL